MTDELKAIRALVERGKKIVGGGSDCDCPPEGHHCGYPEMLYEVTAAEAALGRLENQGHYIAIGLDDVTKEHLARVHQEGFDEAREMIASNAEEVARRLFVSGLDQQQVERLVLTTKDGQDRGGWCLSAVRDRIADAIRAMKSKAEQEGE